MILVGHCVKKYLGLLFTCYCARCRFIFFHSAELVQKYVGSLMNLPDACGQEAYQGRKSCGLKIIQMHVDGASTVLNYSTVACIT